MSAGAIPAPQIIALQTSLFKPSENDLIKKNIREADPSKKTNRSIQNITTNTLISITCDFKQPHIVFFTADESKPLVNVIESRHSTKSGPPCRLKPQNNSTIRYEKPFLVMNGKRTIRAIAISQIDGRESFISSKVFNVEYVEPDTTDDESVQGELYDHRTGRGKRRGRSRSGGRGHSQDRQLGSDGHSPASDGHNQNYTGIDRKTLNDQWSKSFNFQPTPSAGNPVPTAMSLHYNQMPVAVQTTQMMPQNMVYANPDNLDFGGMSFVPNSLGQSLTNPQGAGMQQPFNSSTIYDEFKTNKNDQKICRNRGTQTVGLFYPGGKRMHQEDQKRLEEEFNKIKNKSSENQQFLSKISPGKGYWRKQVDHINGHIKQYASQNLEFRSLIADQKFGKIVHSHIDESVDKVTLSFTFDLHGLNEKSTSRSVNYSQTDMAFGSRLDRGLTEDHRLSKSERDNRIKHRRDSLERNGDRRRSPSPPPKNFQRGRSPTRKEQNPVNRLFLNVLKKSGNEQELDQLISEGADPNCLDYDDYEKSALMVAIDNKNNSVDILRKLINLGANINEKHTPQQLTALHLAVKNENRYAVSVLLENGARTDLNDRRGQSAYDLAVKIGNRGITKMFASSMSQSMLDNYGGSRGRNSSSNRGRETRQRNQTYTDDFGDDF